MLPPWIDNELETADLKDKRLDNRFREVLSQLASRPTGGIPAACGGRAEMAAAYRFFDNGKVTFDTVLAPHVQATRRRIAEQPVVIAVQDTTELDLTRPDQQVRGAGPLDAGARRGALLHLLHVFTPDGTSLGTIHGDAWTRTDDRIKASAQTRAQRGATPIEDKESHRWLAAWRQVCEQARGQSATQFICVADSEADIYEFLVEAQAQPREADWIVRGCQDRALQQTEDCAATHLVDQVAAQPLRFTKTIKVRGRTAKVSCETRGRRQPRQSRGAEVEVRSASLTLRPPWRPGIKLPPVQVNVVLVREVNPPPGEEPVEWLLLTSLPIETLDQVRKVIEYYCVRWMVEVLFRTLKSGCRVEQRRFEQLDRLLPCLAVYLIVAWRTLYVCRLGRSCPEISCEAVFEPSEWKSVCRVVRRKTPESPPLLGEMVRLVAELGGYVNRPRAEPPGPQTIWLGLQRAFDIANCWDLFGPESRPQSG